MSNRHSILQLCYGEGRTALGAYNYNFANKFQPAIKEPNATNKSIFDAKNATINFRMQRIKGIFVAKNTTNGIFHTSKK
ncbi:MAG: hypothetical protein RL308_3453 [Bacteroidota bacterium]|jgi:hypothetical protein